MKNMFIRRSALMLCVAFASFVLLTGCGKEEKKLSFELGDMPEVAQDSDADIDIEALNEAADAIKDLDLSQDNSDYDADSGNTKEAEDEKQAEGELTEYSYTDVVRAGNDITVTPNGGLNASTELYDGKDLGGFLDYVDDSVLEKGRTINRDLFYDLLATMLVDKDLSSSIGAKGLLRKCCIFIMVGVGHLLDTQIFGEAGVLRTAIIFFYMSNEGLSLTENAAHLGLPIPEKLRLVLKQLHTKSEEEKEGDSDEVQ